MCKSVHFSKIFKVGMRSFLKFVHTQKPFKEETIHSWISFIYSICSRWKSVSIFFELCFKLKTVQRANLFDFQKVGILGKMFWRTKPFMLGFLFIMVICSCNQPWKIRYFLFKNVEGGNAFILKFVRTSWKPFILEFCFMYRICSRWKSVLLFFTKKKWKKETVHTWYFLFIMESRSWNRWCFAICSSRKSVHFLNNCLSCKPFNVEIRFHFSKMFKVAMRSFLNLFRRKPFIVEIRSSNRYV